MTLEIQSLSASYGEAPVLHDVQLQVEESEIVSIIGRNGAGKTTTMRAIMGQLDTVEGSIKCNGEEIAELPPDKRAKKGIGYIPQDREVFPNLTVAQNLKVGELIGEQKDDLTDTIYEYFPRLAERKTQKAGTMSGGEQQMLAIGRALVGNPDILLLDEPSEGIQPSIVQSIIKKVKDINQELDVTVLFVEQNINVIQNLSDRAYVMKKGSIVDEISQNQLQSEEEIIDHLSV